MKVLIVDDSIVKIAELCKVIYKHSPNAEIQTCENIANAINQLMASTTFNLLVIDLYLPLRYDSNPEKDGGKKLLNEIYRKKLSLSIPNYIVGFSQLDIKDFDFSPIWNVIQYKNNSNDWKTSFELLLNHIKFSSIHNQIDNETVSSIFVEGLTDKYYLEKALDIFFKHLSNKVKIISQKNAGANWVANQIALWSLKLQKDSEGRYIKACGLLDNDGAGLIAKKNIETRNLSDNEKKCCSSFLIKPNYNPAILEFYQQRCKIEIEIESLFPENILNYAEEKGWLEYRTNPFIENPKDWNHYEETLIDYILSKGIPKENLIYLKKIKMSKKEAFSKYIETIGDENAFKYFYPLLNELLLKNEILKQSISI